ncbi:MAG TPA: N-6 DNA methylase, partial [Methylomirabilota bacterium]|nr:N-6 DNA methylase [Methylomirabilota bacterium]
MLNEISQLFILRILFLRMCEDRGITNYEQLKKTSQTNDWPAFVNLLVESDQRFDSGLFDIADDPFLSTTRQSIRLDSSTVQYIVDSLYFPGAPYTFSVFEPEFLGSVYEQFLTQRVIIDGGTAYLIRKPEHVDRDIIATPRSIIEKIVQDTLSPSIQNLDISSILDKKVLDPACGSGGFLISAFDVLVDVVIMAYLQLGDDRAIYKTPNGWQLTFEEKCRILTNCIYGADRDYAATEVTKFSLLVKLLEEETANSLPDRDGILPRLDHNIFFGDSLVDSRIYDENPSFKTIGPPLTWGQGTPRKFNYIVGNPPYLKTEDMLNLEGFEFKFYKKHYKSAYKQFDKYYLFIERSVKDLLAQNGMLGMIVSRKFFNVQSGKNLRQLLSMDALVTQVVDFGNAQLFEGRTTYTCLLYLSKEKPSSSVRDDSLLYEVVTSPKEWVKQQYGPRTPFSIPRYFV